jgi:Fe-S-cluster containining protein
MTNMFAFVTEEDLSRWENQGRPDIAGTLERYGTVWAGDRIVSSNTGSSLSQCPFLIIENGICSCSIYETRPGVCVDYAPGSSALCPQWEGY